MSRVDLAVSVLQTHTMGILTFNSGVTSTQTVAIQTNAETIVDGVARFAAPHALLGVACAFFCDSVTDRGTDLLDLHDRERRSDVKGGVDVALEASQGIGPGETGRAAIEGLSLYFERLA